MHRSTLAALALTSTASATLQKRQELGGALDENAQYLGEVCAPLNSTNQFDLTFPCNQYTMVQYQCIYGPEFNLTALLDPTRIDDNAYEPDEQNPSTQRNCACQSQMIPLLNACLDCKHPRQKPNLVLETPADTTLRAQATQRTAAPPPTP